MEQTNPYEYAKIYRITTPTGHYYIGSSKARYLSRRYWQHIRDSNREANAKNRLYSHIKANGGWNAVKMEAVETVTCTDATALRLKENEHIIKVEGDPLCLNRNRAILSSPAEKAQRHKEADLRWRAKMRAERNKVIECGCGRSHTVGRTHQHTNADFHKQWVSSTDSEADTQQSTDQGSSPSNTEPTV